SEPVTERRAVGGSRIGGVRRPLPQFRHPRVGRLPQAPGGRAHKTGIDGGACEPSGRSTVTTRVPVDLTVNGRTQTVLVEPRTTLADAMRQELGLTGTHLACEHGVCGACTVLADGEPVRSCLMLAVQAAGVSV